MLNHGYLLVGLLGVLELLFPRQAVAIIARAMFRGGDFDPRDWTYTAARIEGAALVIVALVGLYRSATKQGPT